MRLIEWLGHLVVPQPSNNHKARLLHPAGLSVIVALFLTGQFFLNFFTLVSPSVLGYAANITPERVIELTNQKRAELGLAPLTTNSLLNEIAQRKAADMFAFNYWAHVSPSGRDPWSFFKEVGYKYIYAGENLARDFMDSTSVVEAWMNSPTHKENIVNPNYKEIGVAVVNGTLNGVETTLVVQVFGTSPPTTTAQRKTAPPKVEEAKKEIVQKEIPPVPAPELGGSSFAQEQIPLRNVALARAENETSSPPLFSPFWLTKNIAIFLLGIVLGALVLDAALVVQRRVVRLSGRNIAHLLFIGILLLAMILTTPGAIL
jgi:uncharacterized protein YkwD